MKNNIFKNNLKFTKDSKVLFVYPHPDDETFCNAGLIQRLVKMGVNPYVICLTKGEASTLQYGVSADESLSNVRAEEFTSVMKLLKVENFSIYDFTDGGIENEIDAVSKILETIIANISPDFIFTYEPCGVYGHPDHITLSSLVSELSIKHSIKLIYSTVDARYKPSKQLLSMAKDPESIKPLFPNFVIKLTILELLKKLKCFSLYKSQFNAKSNLIDSIRFISLIKNECYFIV